MGVLPIVVLATVCLLSPGAADNGGNYHFVFYIRLWTKFFSALGTQISMTVIIITCIWSQNGLFPSVEIWSKAMQGDKNGFSMENYFYYSKIFSSHLLCSWKIMGMFIWLSLNGVFQGLSWKCTVLVWLNNEGDTALPGTLHSIDQWGFQEVGPIR